jgi:predicted alpha/beta-hydrolase family hydrolase
MSGQIATLCDGPPAARFRFLFAHGAGGPMDSTFMQRVAARIAREDVRVVRFEFPYMAARREGKRSGAPDRPAVLLAFWRQVIEQERGDAVVVIGGKSMGGRIASMVADESGVAGLVCFGYPFHPPGKPEQLRTAHLETLRTSALILQGERDPFGTREEVGAYPLSPAIRIEWLTDGDHSFKPRKSSGATEAEQVERAASLAAEFIRAR